MHQTKLPLEANIQRCLGHGHKPREWCDRINDCARNATLQHDGTANNISNRACTSDLMAGYIPLDGFPDPESEA